MTKDLLLKKPLKNSEVVFVKFLKFDSNGPIIKNYILLDGYKKFVE